MARKPNRHVAFGHGDHACAGMNVARMEARIAFSRLLARFSPPRAGGRARARPAHPLPRLPQTPAARRGLKFGHDAKRKSAWENPIQTDGFEFVEYAAPDPAALGALFERLGFQAVARHRHKNVLLYKQGDVNFIVNAEPRSFAQNFARRHGPSVCAMAFRVRDAAKANELLLERGAWGVESQPGPGELSIPAIKGIGDSLVYLVDRYPENAYGNTIYDVDFRPLPGFEAFWRGDAPPPAGAGLAYVDHLTHNVHRGRMQEWAEFYERLFNFREIRYFDIEGKLTGLKSKAMTSPCGKIRIPINESSDDRSQIQEYLDAVPRRRHPAHRAAHARHLRDRGRAARQRRRASRYARHLLRVARCKRLPNHGEPVDELKKRKILLDGSPVRRPAAADLHQDHDRADLLRDHPAQRRRRLRRGQLQGAVRIDGARPGARGVRAAETGGDSSMIDAKTARNRA